MPINMKKHVNVLQNKFVTLKHMFKNRFLVNFYVILIIMTVFLTFLIKAGLFRVNFKTDYNQIYIDICMFLYMCLSQ